VINLVRSQRQSKWTFGAKRGKIFVTDERIDSMTWARHFGWLIIPVLYVGCSNSQPFSSVTETQGKSATVAGPVESAPESGTATTAQNLNEQSRRLAEATELARELADVTQAANQSQLAMDFSTAKGHWNRAVEILTRLHGAESWHTKNAREFLKVCEFQSQLKGDQNEDLKKLMVIQDQITKHLQKRSVKDALGLSAEATEICARLYSKDSYLYGKQLTQRGRLEQMNGNLDQAVTHYTESLRLLKSNLGERHPDIEALYGFLGESFIGQRDMIRAIENYKQAVRLSGEIWGETSLEYAIRANDLGVAFHAMKDLPTAAKVLRAAESIRREKLGSDHPQVAHSLYNLAIVYLDMNRHEIAAQSLEQALAIFQKTYPPSNKRLTDCQGKLATTWMLLDKPASAEPLLKELLTIQSNAKVDPQELALTQYRLAIAHAKQKEYTEAEPLFVEALKVQEGLAGPNHANTIRTKNALATLYAQTNRREMAEKMASQVQAVGYTENSNTFQK
jgi:tetratricopeptide (TPR) repeat protein